MKEETPQHEHYLRPQRDVEDISKLATQLAPVEEALLKSGSDHKSPEEFSTLVVNKNSLSIPKSINEDGDVRRGVFGLEPVIVVILMLMIVFIAFISYLVYQMPAPVK